MKIVADQDIFAAKPLFQRFGELVLLPGRRIRNSDLLDADALLVRSPTPVDRSLLQKTRVSFVGAATSGLDHIDGAWLERKGIKLAHSRGANARAVIEYCLGAIANLKLAGLVEAANQRVGVIGAGAIGDRLASLLLELGHEVVVCDPPLAEAGKAPANYDWEPFGAALDCDIVSLHVPLHSGRHATAGLIGREALARLRPGAVLINASRGGVVDENALLARLAKGPPLHCAIDVWQNEPKVNAELARRASLATPHIAGYSEQAKWKASLMLARQLARHLDLEQIELPAPEGFGASPDIAPDWADSHLGPWRLIDQCLGLGDLSARFKAWAAVRGGAADAERIAREFDQLRQPLLLRQEFSATCLVGGEQLSNSQGQWLKRAGFRLQSRR